MKNNFITKIIGATLAFAMMIGGAVGINAAKQANEVSADDVTGEALSFNANSELSGNYDSDWAYAFTKGANGNAPAAYGDGIRVYNAKGANKYGGHLTLSPRSGNDDDYITSVVISVTENYDPTVKVKAGDTSSNMSSATETTLNPSDSTYTFTASNTSTRYIEFTSWGNNDNSYVQWHVKTLTINYTTSGSGGTPATYTVTYDANGATSGSVPEDNTAYTNNQSVTVLGNVNNLSKTDKVWSGWNTSADGTGTSYSAGGTFNITSNITLYARWINDYSDASNYVITANYLGLNTTGISEASVLNANDGMQYMAASSGGSNAVKATSDNASGSNAFNTSAKAILMGKNGAYIYNKDALQKNIGKIEVFSNTGASPNVSIGVSFDSTNPCSSAFSGTATQLSTQNHVYTFNPAITNAKFFRIQVTNAYNAQIQIRISFSNPTTSVTVSPESVTLAPTETQQLTTTVLPANSTDSLVYTTSDDTVATVSESGLITAVAVGTATITATSGNYHDECEVTVELPQTPYITVEETEISGYTGQNEVLSFIYGNLSNLNIVSDDEDVATVGEPVVDGTNGLVQIDFVGAGTATIDFKDGSTTLDSVTATVTASTVTIENMPSSRAMVNGSTLDLGALINVVATGNKTNAVTWSSSDSDVASVNSVGLVTANDVGTATITVTPNDYQAGAVSCSITVANVLSATFGLGTNDGSSVANDQALKAIVGYSIDSNLEFTDIASMYASQGNAIKMGASSTLGKFTVGLINGKIDGKPAYITKIVVNAMKYGSDSTVIKIGGVSKTLTGSFADYEVEFDGNETTSVVIAASTKNNQRYRISNISIFYQIIPAADLIEAQNTRSILSYHYVAHDDGTYTYSDVAIRFGALIEQALWARLDEESGSNIDGYGVLVSDDTVIGNTELKDHYNEANGTTIRDFFMPKATKATPTAASDAQKSDAGVEGDYYIWNRYHTISTDDLTKTFVAVAYIKVDGQIIFMQEERASVKGLAYDLIYNQGVAENTANGSLKNLADLVVA